MNVHIDFPPIKECKHPRETYGEICLQCNDCRRFDYGGPSNPVKSDIRIIIQRGEGIPPGWQYPEAFGGYFNHDGKKCWYRRDKLIKEKTTLEDIIPKCWYPNRLPYLRWWIEGRNY